MKVDKDQFDALLGKLMRTPPQPAKTIETAFAESIKADARARRKT